MNEMCVLLDGDGVLLKTGSVTLLSLDAIEMVKEETLGQRNAVALQDHFNPSKMVVGAIEGRDYATFSLSYVIYPADLFVA